MTHVFVGRVRNIKNVTAKGIGCFYSDSLAVVDRMSALIFGSPLFRGVRLVSPTLVAVLGRRGLLYQA